MKKKIHKKRLKEAQEKLLNLAEQHKKSEEMLTKEPEMQRRDPLTGMLNIKEFEYAMEMYKGEEGCMLVHMSVDKFPEYVEHKGHVQANKMLKTISEQIRNGTTDLEDAYFYRTGTSEFAGILLHSKIEQIYSL